MSIFDELAVVRQVTFKDGDIRLMGQRVVIIQSNFFQDYCAMINDNPERVHEIYKVAKSTFRSGIAEAIGKSYSFNFKNYFDWLTKIAMLAGWGTLTWKILEEEEKAGRITVSNSPVAESLKGKVKSPVDHLIRGFIAGGASASLNADIDAIEEECLATGGQACVFKFKPSGKFELSAEVERQLSVTTG